MSLDVAIKKSFPDFELNIAFKADSETIGLLGASGCGKSLTLRCIAGIEKPDEGHIVVNGETFFDSEKKVNLSIQQRKTAMLFQNYMLFPNLSVAQNVAAGIDKNISKEEKNRLVAHEICRFGLEGLEKRYPAQLSGGQQQRVALARMLVAQPGILMLDEPFSALDSFLKGVLEQNLVDLFDSFEGSILYISHDIDEALRFCDRVAVVDAGHIVEEATGDVLVNKPRSLAGMKLSGCKNTTDAEYLDTYRVRLPQWGIELVTETEVPRDVKFLGVRASYLERVEEPGENVFRVRADRVSDARFERTVLLGFLNGASYEVSTSVGEDEMRYLSQHLYWRVDKLSVPQDELPQRGQDLYIHIPKKCLYLTTC